MVYAGRLSNHYIRKFCRISLDILKLRLGA
jgi:hypothetical protein